MSRLMERNWAKGVGPELDLTGLKSSLLFSPSSSYELGSILSRSPFIPALRVDPEADRSLPEKTTVDNRTSLLW